MSGTVHVENIGKDVCVLTIDNPPMNPLNEAMRGALVAALDETEANMDLRAILITGAGRSFCAGDDLKQDQGKNGRTTGFGRLLQRLDSIRRPVVAAINGWCIGGGFELALCCDIRIASTEASFTCAGVNMGLMASAYRLPRLIGVSRANAMLLTGLPFNAQTAEHYGLVTGLHAPEALRSAAIALTQRIASRAPLSVEATKQVSGKAMDSENLTRENIMMQAANLKDFTSEMLLPGIKINTSPTDFYPIEQMQMMQFDGHAWKLFGDVIDTGVSE
ncbi:enoyl-CoA hydratase/isomerase family protein [Bradyrhizobium sp. LTSPM299]|uniref:enoyl-CoA hydratase/isomerase family protein n=1 Tax=Bradyrhizobium sp. LTSPM299 TaxID=1619233 RepID=UPI0006791A53|nr:enoyl-CoA hydratase/isomerase family protein [Bradyrhizobium sp. LTSPM299]